MNRGLFTYLSLFHLKQTDAIAEQLQIFLSSLAGHLGSAELFVKGSIIVLLVRGQVHLIELHFILHVLLGRVLLVAHELLFVVHLIAVKVILVVHISLN